MLMLMGGLYLLSSIGSAIAWDAGSFAFFRLIGGLALGEHRSLPLCM